VAALETYAKEGKLDDDLAVYAQYLRQQLAQLRSADRIKLSPVAVSAVSLHAYRQNVAGTTGQVIKTGSVNRLYVLRSALTLAAADPGLIDAAECIAKVSHSQHSD